MISDILDGIIANIVYTREKRLRLSKNSVKKTPELRIWSVIDSKKREGLRPIRLQGCLPQLGKPSAETLKPASSRKRESPKLRSVICCWTTKVCRSEWIDKGATAGSGNAFYARWDVIYACTLNESADGLGTIGPQSFESRSDTQAMPRGPK
jgi:hypothetical protein